MTFNMKAAKTAVSDTIVATPINLVLNYILLKMFLPLSLTAELMTIIFTSIFFVVACVRKYFVISFFNRRNK
jgi:hypothetical protein